MSITRHQFLDDPSAGGKGSASELRPYFFHRDATDLFEEAFHALLRRRLAPGASSDAEADEREVLREQRAALFAYDAVMQRMFGGDFEAFSAACDDPRRMHERVREWLQQVRGDRAPRTAWDDPARAWEHAHDHVHGRHDAPAVDDDPVYDAAFRWACRTDRWSRRLYVGGRVRDRDVFRVLTNAVLVPAKVAYGFSAMLDRDLAGYEVAAVGYRIAGIFLSRTVESLANCHGKRIGRPQTVHDLMDEGREVLADVESRLAEIESEIRHRRGDDT